MGIAIAGSNCAHMRFGFCPDCMREALKEKDSVKMISARQAREQLTNKFCFSRLMDQAECRIKRAIDSGKSKAELPIEDGFRDDEINRAIVQMQNLGYFVTEKYDEIEKCTVLTLGF